MSVDFGNMALIVGTWVVFIAIIVGTVLLIRKFIRCMHRRESDRHEMLELMRRQSRNRDAE